NEMNVPPSKKAKNYIVTEHTDIFNEDTFVFFQRLASASEVEVVSEYADSDAVQIVTPSCTVYIPLAEVLDMDKELERLNKEREKTIGEIDRLEKKLGNEGFVAKAPAAVVEGEKAKLAKYKDVLAGVEAAIAKIKK
ncbi:MAG: valine--tRNA ligase, partial [Clostridia bacterium]|nr:valine--tRNA ligase [Clostridia bacterium]